MTQPMETLPSFSTPKELASMLKISILTVYDYIRRGNLRAIKLGRTYRVSGDSLTDFLSEHMVVIHSVKSGVILQSENNYE